MDPVLPSKEQNFNMPDREVLDKEMEDLKKFLEPSFIQVTHAVSGEPISVVSSLIGAMYRAPLPKDTKVVTMVMLSGGGILPASESREEIMELIKKGI